MELEWTCQTTSRYQNDFSEMTGNDWNKQARSGPAREETSRLKVEDNETDLSAKNVGNSGSNNDIQNQAIQ